MAGAVTGEISEIVKSGQVAVQHEDSANSNTEASIAPFHFRSRTQNAERIGEARSSQTVMKLEDSSKGEVP